jgi:hypothetical protein
MIYPILFYCYSPRRPQLKRLFELVNSIFTTSYPTGKGNPFICFFSFSSTSNVEDSLGPFPGSTQSLVVLITLKPDISTNCYIHTAPFKFSPLEKFIQYLHFPGKMVLLIMVINVLFRILSLIGISA